MRQICPTSLDVFEEPTRLSLVDATYAVQTSAHGRQALEPSNRPFSRNSSTGYIFGATTYIFPVSERVRSAIQNSGLEFPNNKRITVNLAPADLPKDSGRFDLPIALGILGASGQIDAAKLAGHEFAGELSLSGELRSVRGALAMSLALHTAKVVTQLVLPPGSAEEAALVPGAQVYRAHHLLDVVQHFLPDGAAKTVLEPAANAGPTCHLP